MFDFIVVGAGPAGACVASRLARSKNAPQVLLLEAGSADVASNPSILAERFSSFMQYPSHNWGYKTVAQKHTDGRELNYVRGKGLGGTSNINFSAWTIGPRDDYDRWAAEVGDVAFDWEHSVRSRKNIESYAQHGDPKHAKYATPDMAVHGVDGPLRIEYARTGETPMTVLLEAAEECGMGVNPDGNSGNPLGLSSIPSTALNGRRVTAATAYLSDPPTNFTIIGNAPVSRVLLDGAKAIGVIANGVEYRASRDVILSAGAIDSPKIMMLSGIGDSSELEAVGIESTHHLPGVGNNLEDHYFTALAWRQTDDLSAWSAFFSNPEAMKAGYEQFSHDGTGPLSEFHQGMALGYFKADSLLDTPAFANLPKPIQAHIRKPTVPLWELATWLPPFDPRANPKHTYLTAAIFLHCPQARGTVKLASSNPQDAPFIDPNYFSTPFDHACAIAATNKVLDYVQTPCIQKDIVAPFAVPASRSDEDILAFWRANGQPTYHASCTVKMGKADDPEACLDTDFRVLGLENLRVVDTSAAPFLPSCHPMAIAYFVGECAAEKMINEYGLDL